MFLSLSMASDGYIKRIVAYVKQLNDVKFAPG